MITVTKQYRTETGHRLTNYNGKCAHLHGHSYLWELTVYHCTRGAPANGMVVDFKDVKRAMKDVLEPLDHALVLGPDDPLWHLAEASGSPLTDTLRATNGHPPRLFEWHDNPTAESFAQWAVEQFRAWFDRRDIVVDRVRVWETATSFAEARNMCAGIYRELLP